MTPMIASILNLMGPDMMVILLIDLLLFGAKKLLARQGAVEISRVSRDNFFLFTPMLHEIAASDLEITNIVNPLRKLLRKVEVLVGEVNEIDLPNKRVLISRGYRNHSQEINY